MGPVSLIFSISYVPKPMLTYFAHLRQALLELTQAKRRFFAGIRHSRNYAVLTTCSSIFASNLMHEIRQGIKR
jgi:hypothetical protein